MNRQLPVDIHAFETIRNENYVYVDKTQLLYQMITEGKMYFLARPRRFGKSLLISTLKALFQGKRHLFKDLWIDQSDYTWEEHPVIWLDMSLVTNSSKEEFQQSLNHKLNKVANQYGVQLPSSLPMADRLDELITQLAERSQNKQVVVLIDEYDSPLINQIDHPTKASENRGILKQFYGVLKAQNANIRFLLLTGVSKFSQVSIFSGLNNLQDISLQPAYATLLGYTQQELTSYFQQEIDSLAQKEGLSHQETLDKIKYWYNGYRFSREEVAVYNPFSTLLLFKNQEFAAHWFASGTPTFLINLIQTQQYDLTNTEDALVKLADFSAYEVDNLRIIPLLYQTGYLTIKGYDADTALYTLSYPNWEVKTAFLDSLFKSFVPVEEPIQNKFALQMMATLKQPSIDEFVEVLQDFLVSLPYDLVMKGEKYYQNVFYLIFKLVGLQVSTEVHTHRGRIDIVIENPDNILIFEMKLDQSAQVALQQIKEKGYADHYKSQQKAVYLIGLNFSSEKNNVDDYVYEKLT